MRLASPLPPKKPLRVLPKPRAAKPPAPARGVSWWTTACQPDQREQFAAAARARNIEAQSDPVWQRPTNFGQIGQL